MYSVTKTYPHSLGLSACFRQHHATSHCRHLHGYALAFTVELACDTAKLQKGWVYDFGGLKPLKAYLVEMFDHKLLIAGDDPAIDDLCQLAALDLADPLVLPAGVGCEAFAKLVFQFVENLMLKQGATHVQVVRVECREHEGNAATYYGEDE